MIRKLLRVFLTDALLIGFAATLLLIFGAILLMPNHEIGLEEQNPPILLIEILICVFSIGWASKEVFRKIRLRKLVK